ncbi:DUF817 domain-containing protein [uncultured Bradyrhizobium sp.]|uniref:DUF817 domain-containing protein n=1 Tax=uncultured Bradyrhizobium sp. TaxID=199684 RepID=UPI002611ABAF|nr:DUF817 domain-containing protein [uncultured Bradyrhizobium sp.]
MHHRLTRQTKPIASAAANWPALRRFIAGEHRLGLVMAQRRWTAAPYEFLRFGIKQAWACLFGGIAVALMIGTWRFYPPDAALARYDFLFLSMLAVQLVLLAGRLETWEEARVILIYHVVGTAMELFKTRVGSWIYPEPSIFHIGGVPLFSGFMYSCIGSYICRCWRLFDFRFSQHPRRLGLIALSVAIYVNFFSHHYVIDLRWGLFAWAIWLFGRTSVHFKVWTSHRSMPLLLGLVLVSLFIWFTENIGTFTKTWLYPSQRLGWSMVGIEKLGSWFLLVIVSYTLVSLVNAPRSWKGEGADTGARRRDERVGGMSVPTL